MIRSSLISALLLMVSSASYAVPVYYTFTGNVYSVSDSAGIVADTYSLTDPSEFIGAAVEYIYLVDTAEPAFATRYDGSTFTYTDESTSDYSVDYFYSDFISGSLISGFEYYSSSGFVSEYNFGRDIDYNSPGVGTDQSLLIGESTNDYTYVYNVGILFEDWIIGTSFTGVERAYNSRGAQSSILSSLQLTNISDSLPAVVPVPAAVWLFGTALIGLFGFSKRRKVA